MSDSLILASSSAARRSLLERARVPFQVVAPNVDEAIIKADCEAQRLSPIETAMFLARAKADDVGKNHPDALVLGADQILTCENVWFDKPVGVEGLRVQLTRLSGRAHELVNAAAVVQGGMVVWQYQDIITMVMRLLSDAFIEAYINEVGEMACQSVGGYQLEGMGAQIFERVDGDMFSILGLPLLPLLELFRDREILIT